MAKKKTTSSLGYEQIFQLRVSLNETTPLVWRRVLVPGYFNLEKLHSVLQIVMGWQMCHLYDFHIGKSRYAEPDDFDPSPVKSLTTSISRAFGDETSIIYNYDFGDDWRHQIHIEEISSVKEEINYPICIGGENACPPEDCGGVFGYQELKNKIADPRNPDHTETIRWLRGYFNPSSFDPNRINRDLLWSIDWKAKPNDQGLYVPFSSYFADEDGPR